MRPLLAALVLLAAAPLPAAAELRVFLDSPEAAQPAFGTVEIAARVEPLEEVALVEFWVDGERLGTAESPPFRLSVELGEENRSHRFLVRAIGRAGDSGEAELVTPPIRVDMTIDVELQQLYVTVSRDERRVLDLVASDFEVLDEGAPQQLVTFARGDVPLAGAVLVDASASMRGRRLRFAVRGASAFAAATRPADEVSVQLFSDRLLYASPYVSDLGPHAGALATVEAEGGTALLDHLYRALKQLEARQGRRVAVLMTDGFDSHSVLGIDEVVWLARRSRTMLYWIRLDFGQRQASRYSAWKTPADYRRQAELLERLVGESGGRTVDIDRIEETETAVREILAELREQYVLGYYPTTRRNDGSWRKVRVRVARPGTRVRTKGGYVDY